MLNSKDLKGRYSSTKNWEINIKILKTCAVVSTYQKKKKNLFNNDFCHYILVFHKISRCSTLSLICKIRITSSFLL